MSKILISLVLLCMMAVGAFFYLTYFYARNTTFHALPFSPTPSAPQSTLVMSPSVLHVTSGIPTSVQVLLNNPTSSPKIIQLELAYQPNFLTDIVVTPGDYFVKPTVSLNTINPRIGRISYALEASPDGGINQKSPIVATITFTPYLSIAQKETTLYFMPKTSIRGQDDTNSLQAAYGTTIRLEQPGVLPTIIQPINTASSPATIQQTIH